MNSPPPRGLSFRAKLLLSLTLLSLTLCGAALYLSLRAAEEAAHLRIEDDFRRSEGVLKRLIETRIAAFSEATAASLSDALFRSQIGRSDSSDADLGLGDDQPAQANTLDEVHGIFASADLPLFHRYPLVAVTASDGRLIFSKSQPKEFGSLLPGIEPITLAMKGAQTAALVSGKDPGYAMVAPDGEVYLVLARPIVTAQGPVGVVIAGETVRSLLDEVASITAATVSVHAASGEVASSGAFVDIAERASVSDIGIHEIPTATARYLALVTQLPGLGEQGRATLVRSLSAELAPFVQRLRLAALWVVIIAAVVSIVVAILLSHLMTRPLLELEAAAQRLRGGDLNVSVATKSGDEIGHLAYVFNEMVIGLRQRDQIKATFKRYLAPAVVDELIKHPERLNLGGEKRELSILFSDLVGFTSLSEGRDAQELVGLLNEYFDEVGQAIVARGGTLDKFAGDSVMCFFGAPIAQSDHRARALLSGVDHLRVVDSVRERWAKLGRPLIDCRIGINTGEVVVGNIGSQDGQDYTVIGDPVNLASRLEGANKEYKSRFMVSEETLRGCEHLVETRELDLLRVKGKAHAVRVYEILGLAGSLSATRRELMQIFAAGLAAYRASDFSAAAMLFAQALELDPKDGASAIFADRVAAFQKDPPPADWGGVYAMTSK